MAPAALPLAKLGSLLIKTLAKPVAKRIKHSMVRTPMTRTSLIWVGQTTHSLTTRMTIWSAGYKIRSISRLDDEEALSRGADILSESFIFGVSGAIVVWEYNRSKEKEKKKEEEGLQKIRDEATTLQAKLDSLDTRLLALEEYAKANRRSIILGIGVGTNGEYVEPKAVVPINDKENDPNAEGSTDEDAKGDDAHTDEQSNKSEKKSRHWWWPFR